MRAYVQNYQVVNLGVSVPKTNDASDHLFIFIGDMAFSLADLGPAADMRIDAAFQNIIDRGLLGQEFVGKKWFEVIQASSMKMEPIPSEDEVLLNHLYTAYKDALVECMALSRTGQLTNEKKAEMNALRLKYKAARKLSTP